MYFKQFRSWLGWLSAKMSEIFILLITKLHKHVGVYQHIYCTPWRPQKHLSLFVHTYIITLLVKVSQGHNYQIATNKTCTAHEVLFLQIAHVSGQTTANKLSMGHRVLFLQIAQVSGQTTANKLSTSHRVLFLQIAHTSRQTTVNKLSTCHRVLFLQIAHMSRETGANKLPTGYGSLFLYIKCTINLK